MADFEPALSGEMVDQLVLDVYEHVKAGTLSKLKQMGVAREMIAKRDEDGDLIYYDIRLKGQKEPIVLGTMIERIRIIIKGWKKYLAPLMETLVLEAAYSHALKARENVTSFKAVSELIMPKGSDADEDKIAVPPRVANILQQNPVGTIINIGKDNGTERPGDEGHQCADTVHPLANGRGEDITAEAVSLRDVEPVFGLCEGDDTAERYIVPDTEMAPEDPVDNDGGANIGTPG